MLRPVCHDVSCMVLYGYAIMMCHTPCVMMCMYVSYIMHCVVLHHAMTYNTLGIM